MIERTLKPVLRSAATNYPVVTLTGPRQAGKTTLARMAFPDYHTVALEDLTFERSRSKTPAVFGSVLRPGDSR